MNAVTAGGPGLVGVGSQGPWPDDAVAWVSDDGVAWTRVESDSFSGLPNQFGRDGEQTMTDVTSGPNGLVAVGFAEDATDHDFDAAVWVSSDGVEWARLEDDEGTFGGAEFQAMWRVITWGDGLVAVGASGGGRWDHDPTDPDRETTVIEPRVWVSPNGIDWQRMTGIPTLGFPSAMADIAEFDQRLVAVGWMDIGIVRPAAWVSVDGQSWDLIAPDGIGDWEGPTLDIGEVGSSSQLWLTAVAAADTGLFAVGNEGVTDVGAVWWSPDGVDWTRLSDVRDDVNPQYPVTLTDGLWTDGLLLAVGAEHYTATDWEPRSLAGVWASRDRGETWHQVTALEVVPGWPPFAEVVPFGDAMLAVGSTRVTDYVWSDTDPMPWSAAAVWIGTWSSG
jgi:hypothetical protein